MGWGKGGRGGGGERVTLVTVSRGPTWSHALGTPATNGLSHVTFSRACERGEGGWGVRGTIPLHIGNFSRLKIRNVDRFQKNKITTALLNKTSVFMLFLPRVPKIWIR